MVSLFISSSKQCNAVIPITENWRKPAKIVKFDSIFKYLFSSESIAKGLIIQMFLKVDGSKRTGNGKRSEYWNEKNYSRNIFTG